MAQQKSKPKSKKKKRTSTQGSAPRAVRSDRREVKAAQQAKTIQKRQSTARKSRTLGGVGERPPSPFGFPLSEMIIAIGIVSLIIGLIDGGTAAIAAGAGACMLGVGEVNWREHHSGFRPHATLLAGLPAVVVMVVIGFVLNPNPRAIAIPPGLIVGAICFYFLRKQFQGARQRRVVSST